MENDMSLFQKLSSLWRNILGIPRTILTMFGPPPFDGYADPPTEPQVPVVNRRDPKVEPIEGDVFAGVHGGIRRFRGFNLETDEAEFTRADRPNLCRESRAKWFAFASKATVVSKNERP